MSTTQNSEASVRRTGTLVEVSIHEDRVNAFVPNPLPPAEPAIEFDDDMRRLLDRANHALGKLDGFASISQQPDLELLIYAYARKEAVLSSQIEGTQSSLHELLLFEAEEVPGVPVDDVRETLNYLDALSFALDQVRNDVLPISNRLIKQAHKKLLDSSRGGGKQPGAFRDSPVWIGGRRPRDARFVPPPATEIPALMADVEKFIHNDPVETSPIVKAALVHVQFETIHPFLDGNGRLGRLLITLILSAEGLLQRPLLYLSLYFKQNRDLYYESLQRVRTHGDWEGWLRFFLVGVIEVSAEAIATAGRIVELLKEDRSVALGLSRASSVTAQVFDYASNRVVVIPRRVASDLGLSPSSVNSAIQRLTDAEILEEVTGKKRNRVYAYSKYLSILNEGTEPLVGD